MTSAMGTTAGAPALQITGFRVVGACCPGSGQSSPAAREACRGTKSLLSELLCTPNSMGDGRCAGQLWTESGTDSEVYSEDEDDGTHEGAVAIAIRDDDHYKRMLRARAIVNCRLWQQHQPQQHQQ